MNCHYIALSEVENHIKLIMMNYNYNYKNNNPYKCNLWIPTRHFADAVCILASTKTAMDKKLMRRIHYGQTVGLRVQVLLPVMHHCERRWRQHVCGEPDRN